MGEDLEKDLFLEGFNKKLIQTSFQYSTNPTGVCFIFVTPDGERTMASNLSANEDLNPKCLNKEILSQSDWLLFDAFSVCTSNGLKTAKEALLVAKQNKVKIAFGLADINLIKSNLKEIEWVLNQSIDLLFSNENEINLMQQSIKPKVDILCSSGANGCRFNQVKVDAKDISVINTNGAGDALVGIFLSHYNSLPQQEALKRAVDYATEVCQIGGPRI
jgi:sugar/nucleoside kinase (ribokinase family)